MGREQLRAEMRFLSDLIMRGAREVECGSCGITLLIPADQDGYTCDECGFSPNPNPEEVQPQPETGEGVA